MSYSNIIFIFITLNSLQIQCKKIVKFDNYTKILDQLLSNYDAQLRPDANRTSKLEGLNI